MKGNVVLQLNDDNTFLVAAAVPFSPTEAKVHHYSFSADKLNDAIAKTTELVVAIKSGYVESKIHKIH